MSPDFDPIDRDGWQVWLHKAKPVWIVFYEAIEGLRLARYEVYRAVKRVPKGRDPWSVDNKKLQGPGDTGFPTLEEAMTAASACQAPIHEVTA